jgi:hypothetical protein
MGMADRGTDRSPLSPQETRHPYRLPPIHNRTRGGTAMARRTVLVSDISGKEIDDRNAATVTIRYSDARRGQVVLDFAQALSLISATAGFV